jgi:hypothetical protein
MQEWRARWTEMNACQSHAKTMEHAWTEAMAFVATVFQDIQVFYFYKDQKQLLTSYCLCRICVRMGYICVQWDGNGEVLERRGVCWGAWRTILVHLCTRLGRCHMRRASWPLPYIATLSSWRSLPSKRHGFHLRLSVWWETVILISSKWIFFLQGFTGERCELELSMCRENPCSNGAICIEEGNSSTCYCVPDFHGDLCQFQYDECLLPPTPRYTDFVYWIPEI